MCGVLKDPLCADSYRLHIALRSKVLRELSVFPRDIKRFQQFLSFFADSEAEAHSMNALKEFAKIIPGKTDMLYILFTNLYQFDPCGNS